MHDRELFRQAADHAADFLETLDTRPVRDQAEAEELYASLSGPLPENGLDDRAVLAELVEASDPGLVASQSYWDRTPYVEVDDATGVVAYVEHHRTLGDWVGLLAGAGFVITRLLEPEWPGPDVRLEADLSRVRQVLVNLVANAVKFTPAGGIVKVRAWVENGHVRFMVSDSGIGIPAKDLPHIFDRFYRVTKGRSRLQGGSGLGLTIVKQAIDAHRGEIGVESTEGKGTTFYFQLPTTQRESN